MSALTLEALSTSDLAAMVATMSPEAFAALAAAARDRKTNEREARKTITLRARKYVQELVTSVTSDVLLPARTFTSGAEGWSLGGSKFTSEDGRTYRVSLLIRDEATIPEKETVSEPESVE